MKHRVRVCRYALPFCEGVRSSIRTEWFQVSIGHRLDTHNTHTSCMETVPLTLNECDISDANSNKPGVVCAQAWLFGGPDSLKDVLNLVTELDDHRVQRRQQDCEGP